MRFPLLIVFVLAFGLITGGYLALATGVPSIAELKKYRATEGTKVYADDDTLIGEFKIEKGIFVPLERIPAPMKNAIVAVEDSRFWQHKGIDYIGIARALVKDIMHASLKEGGSTITQQLAKIVFLSPEKTIQRKLREAQLAMKLEKELTKKEILELYLNKVYFGHGAYGVEMAARTYFGKSVGQLTLPEAAMLAGLVKAPTTYSPYNDLVRAKERQEIVLVRMEEEGYIKPSERNVAKTAAIALSSLRAGTETNNYFLEYIRQQLEQKYGVEMVYKGDLKVHTALNRNAQAAAQRALQEGLRDIDKRRGWRGPIGHKDEIKEDSGSGQRVSFTASPGDISTGVVLSVSPTEAAIKARGLTGKLSLADAQWASNNITKNAKKAQSPKHFKLTDILVRGDIIWVRVKAVSGKNVSFSLEQEPEVEGALAAVEPETGYIRALVGGYSFTKSEYNRALYAKRQPGSSFKPLIFAAALERNFTPASIIDDAPVSYPGGTNGEWKPENYDHKYYGPTRLREALAYSRNVVTIKLVENVGIDNIISFVRDVGIETDMPRELTIALGSISITPLEMAVTYSTFANGGTRMTPIAVKYVTDAKGRLLENNEPEGIEVVSPQTSFLITSMMEDVINYGTGMRATIGRPAAGKTGTSNDYKDAWFIGYTPQLVGCVWVGFDDMRKSLGRGEVGGRAAAPIWAHFMRNTLAGIPPEPFPLPEGIIQVSIDPVTGLLSVDDSSAVYEYFREGTQPTEYSPSAGRVVKEIIQTDYD
ncbi:MAG: PBP1A family penicillin-binding protein [Alphaproteobacteria bacterium]|uniref:Penicillin-binding protein 1A n=1 Tax=Candidatus Nitrobium versatile TaxID=2884831 RepID=A0A953J7M9_9BACT|nr:PBP1A family penicillin-binding protein [Candidatus Nitrobium versatile]